MNNLGKNSLNRLKVEVKEDKNELNLFGIIIQVKERESDRIVWQRVYTFQNQFKALMRIAGQIRKLNQIKGVKPETHYIEIRPTLKHRKPEWLLKQLKDKVRVLNGADL